MTAAAATFEFVRHWPQGTPKDDMAVLEFWRREGALNDEVVAQERLREIVMHAVAPSGEVAAVCTAVPKTLPRLGQPLYYFRCFVGKSWRRSGLGLRMLREAQVVLEEYARAHAFPCIGMLLELENAMFADRFRTAVWSPIGFVYIGKSARGLDLRVWYFRDAELKNA